MAAKHTIDLCIAHGANLSALRYDGAKPLALACQKHPCQVFIVDALLEAGCDPNEHARNDQGVLPSIPACGNIGGMLMPVGF